MSRTILLVDDEDDIREVAQLSLEMTAGWEVLTASSGAEAIDIAVNERPDAILLDVMMPGMDGPTILRALRAEGGMDDIPVILLTAKVQSADRRGFEDLRVAGILSKPFDPMDLARQVSGVLGWEA